MSRAVIVGGGHNGLIAACYLARAGLAVTVLEQADAAGGGSRTEETIPGYRFNTHSAAHNIINMTSIPAELDLAGAGLEYIPMEPFATGFFRDGRIVRFHRDIDQTVASIAEHDKADAEAYRAFMHKAVPLVKTAVTGLESGSSAGGVLKAAGSKLWPLLQGVKRSGGPIGLAHDLVTPYGSLLERVLRSDLTRAPISSFASHSSAGPHQPGGAFFVYWQAAYHLYGQWHPRGGSQALTDALERRLTGWGGQTRTSAVVARIDAAGGRARAVLLEDGERIEASAVITATDVQTALLDLLDPPLADELGSPRGSWPPRRGGCPTRRRPTASPRACTTTAWPRPGTTPSTWPARARRMSWTAAGRVRPSPSPTRWSSRSSSTRPASATASWPGPSAHRRSWRRSCAGPERIRCTSTSAWTSSRSCARPAGCPGTPSRACRGCSPAARRPRRSGASPAAAARRRPCSY